MKFINLSTLGLVQLNIVKDFVWSFDKKGRAPIYLGSGSIILKPRLQYIGAPFRQKSVFFVLFLNMNHSKLKVLSPFDRP